MYRDTFAEVLGSGVVGTLPNSTIINPVKIRVKSLEIKCFSQRYKAYPDRGEKVNPVTLRLNPSDPIGVGTLPMNSSSLSSQELNDLFFLGLQAAVSFHNGSLQAEEEETHYHRRHFKKEAC